MPTIKDFQVNAAHAFCRAINPHSQAPPDEAELLAAIAYNTAIIDLTLALMHNAIRVPTRAPESAPRVRPSGHVERHPKPLPPAA